MILQTLRTGQHRVVIRHGDDRLTFDLADAADQTVGGGAVDEVVELAPPSLRSDDERSVLDERAFVAQVVDVLARGALAGPSSSFDRIRPRRVGAERVARL